LVERDFEEKKDNALGEGDILGMGSRIIPMDQGVMDDFGKGITKSQTADRTEYRGVRRLRQRHLLRRERLHRVLNIIGALPKHYADKIDFENKKGQFINDVEVKLNYKKTELNRFEFLFKDSFNEMVEEFKAKGQETKMPYDWTIYYLRKKALEEQISLQELSWLLLNFNQKRGYYQLRGEEEEIDKTKLVEFYALKVVKVTAEEANSKNEIWYNVFLENGWIYRRKSKDSLSGWVGKMKEFIVTTTLEEDGSVKKDKDGAEKRSFKAVNSEEDWIAIKKSTEEKIENTKQFVGTYIYNTLLKNPKQKINGKLVRTIERHFYKDELIAILEKQLEFHMELNRELLEKCIVELYPNNYAQQNILKQKDFVNLFVNDIIFYQRPLKSKKSLIDGCKYESRVFRNKEGDFETKAIKVIHKSHPLYQEFRLWQFVSDIRIYEREKTVNGILKTDIDVTSEFITDENARVELFDFFNNKAKIKQKTFLANYKDEYGKKLSEAKYRWNYVEDKEYPLNETRALFISKLSKDKDFEWERYLTKENEIKLWHLLYSISDKKEIERALKIEEKYKNDIVFGLPFEIRKEFARIKPFANDYGAFSEKAIKKLLPLIRMGKYWSVNDIDDNTKDRIEKIINGEFDEKIRNRVREKAINLNSIEVFKALPLWLASYIVYDRHSESSDNAKWETPKQLDLFLKEFKQHSLRNPIVEQVITETLRVVRDIWAYYGNGKEDFFDEIHVELGRDMKNPKNVREQIAKNVTGNQNTNERVRALLREFKNENIEGVIPHSPSQQEKLKIFEEDILNQYSEKELEREVYDGVNISKVAKASEPTAKEIQKYRLWMEQKYRSPYTGQVISLSKLFTTEYEIEHIIPQARYFDNSLGNKVICETEVNKFKGNQTAFEMISKNPGRKIDLGQGSSATLFSLEVYQNFVSESFRKGSKKFKILLSEDVPEQFISRQLNDTRYISKVVKGLLSNIVREEDEQEATSKNIVAVTGGVTTILKKDWGLNDKWNEIVQPRFERMNRLITKEGEELSTVFGKFDKKANFYRTDVPKELKKNFNKKRIDHRHHAMDALVVACATRNHVGYLNNEHAKSDNKRYDLRNKLRRVEEIERNGTKIKVSKEFYKPWGNFPIDAKDGLENIVVSFKQNLRVINKATNWYQTYYDENGDLRKDKAGNPKKEFIRQTKGDNWAIRKPLHKETVSGKVGFPAPKGKIAAATRVSLSDIKTEKHLEKITDVSIRKILEKHVTNYIDDEGKANFELAFNQEGIDELNKNIKTLNNGKNHQPIYKVRLYEVGSKFNVGYVGNKKDKYVEAAKGTNLFFAVYENEETKKREYETVPLNVVIEHQKQDALLPKNERTPIPINKEKGKFLFVLSPNDLVYVPSDDEIENPNSVDYTDLSKEQKERVYVVNDFSSAIYFTPNQLAKHIAPKEVDLSYDAKKEKLTGSFDTKTASMNGVQIKERCWKLKADRLGNVVKVGE